MSALPDDQTYADTTAGERIARLLDIVRSAETEMTLDWIERIPDMGHISADVRVAAASASVRVAIKARRAEIAARPARLF